jgi:hypothetical protein
MPSSKEEVCVYRGEDQHSLSNKPDRWKYRPTEEERQPVLLGVSQIDRSIPEEERRDRDHADVRARRCCIFPVHTTKDDHESLNRLRKNGQRTLRRCFPPGVIEYMRRGSR